MGGRGTIGQPRTELREMPGRGPETRSDRLRALRVQVVRECLDERQVGQRELRLAAGPPQDLATELPGEIRELVGEPRLADPGLSGEDREPAVAPMRGHEGALENRELIIALDENGAKGTWHGTSDGKRRCRLPLDVLLQPALVEPADERLRQPDRVRDGPVLDVL